VKEAAMRFAIGLSCLVLAISIFSQAQSKALHQTKSEIMSVTLSHDDWGVEDAACDSKGNTFATLWKSEVDDGPADRPLLMFDHAGVLKARFSSSSKDDPRLFIHESTALMSDGGVARLTWSRWSREPPWLTVFSSDGKLKSRVQLDPPGFFPSQLAVFPSGESLVSGLEHVHSSRAVGPYKSFTAIYDKNGHLQKRLSLPEDAEIDADAERGDSRYAHGPMFGNLAVAFGRARLGDDENVYLMRRTSPATVYVISSSGELLRTLSIEPAGHGQMPYEMRVAEGHIAVEFNLSCSSDHFEGSNFTVADAMTGQKLADYADDKSLGGIFAYYSAKPERFTFLLVRDNKLQMIEASAK
jgi:hypothetical protein